MILVYNLKSNNKHFPHINLLEKINLIQLILTDNKTNFITKTL